MPFSRIDVFAGPTRGRLLDRPAWEGAVRWRPPAGRGDVERLVATERPGTLALVDGLFQERLAVGHAEILAALRAGWIVWGLSSMGAIRAFEMRYLGVRGVGRVYRHFLDGADFRDDEVALLHEPEHPYRAFTEPLIHLRYALADLRDRGDLSPDAHDDVVRSLSDQWFGERTMDRFIDLVLAVVRPDRNGGVRHRLADFDRYRIKQADLVEFLELGEWRNPKD